MVSFKIQLVYFFIIYFNSYHFLILSLKNSCFLEEVIYCLFSSCWFLVCKQVCVVVIYSLTHFHTHTHIFIWTQQFHCVSFLIGLKKCKQYVFLQECCGIRTRAYCMKRYLLECDKNWNIKVNVIIMLPDF